MKSYPAKNELTKTDSDMELRAILLEDLKKFRTGSRELISNNQANTQDNDLLVA